MNLLKKQGIGTWISLGTILISIIALIIYGASISAGDGLLIAAGSEPFYDSTTEIYSSMVTSVVACGVIGLIFLAVAIVLSQLKFEGIVGKVVDMAVGAMRILVPVLLIILLLNFLNGSFTGLGWTFFSDEVLAIAPEATQLGTQVIVTLVLFAIAAVAGVVATFFPMVKSEEAAA